MAATIRLAKEEYGEQMLDIYAPIVRNTAISFELEPPTADEFLSRVTDYLKVAPWLVCESDSRVVGYAYAGRHRARVAYQ